MRIANGVEMLEISANLTLGPGIIHPTLVWDQDEAILVDVGFPGQLPQIKEAIEKAGVSFSKLSKIIITHHDLDHVGSLTSILRESDHKIEVLAHEKEKAYIQGELLPIKMAQSNTIPAEQLEKMKMIYRNKVDKTLNDGEELSCCGGIEIIHTPGHTPGHICIYLKESKILITGDALNITDGQLVGPAPQFTFDMAMAIQSLQKLTRYDIKKVICYHGGLYESQANQRITELANG
jgi:glyoxylase-like metal-dependent hydrolase (beta-lactamase superfamily II)